MIAKVGLTLYVFAYRTTCFHSITMSGYPGGPPGGYPGYPSDPVSFTCDTGISISIPNLRNNFHAKNFSAICLHGVHYYTL